MTKMECLGQTACAKIGGHILEFNETNWKGEKNFQNKIKALLEKFGYIHMFYVGLTDIEKQDVWKWTNSGKIVPSDKVLGPNLWANGEPNNQNLGEHCAQFKISAPSLIPRTLPPNFIHYDKLHGLNDIKCSTLLPIICEKIGYYFKN